MTEFDLMQTLTDYYLIILPALAFVGLAILKGFQKKTEKDFNSFGGFLAGAVLFRPMRMLKGLVYIYLPAFDYAKLNLENKISKHLQVPSHDNVEIETDTTFVTLKLDGDNREHDHSTILKEANRLCVIGDPGSGKSTIVKRLFRDQCRLLANWRTAHLGLLPVIINLRDIKIPEDREDLEKAEWLLGIIRSQVKNVTAYEMENCFEHFINDRGLLVLLDGADEINTDDFQFLADVMNDFSSHLSDKSINNRIVLTMRTQFHIHAREIFKIQFPKILKVKPFTPTDIYTLLTRWPFPKETRSQHAARIYSDLSDRPSLRELCYNPLVVSMYIAEDQRRVRAAGGSVERTFVPDSRTDFYDDVLTELIIKRRESQKGVFAGRVPLKRQRDHFFGRLCFEHLMDKGQPANAIPFSSALQIAKDINLEDGDQQAITYIRELSRDTGIFSEEKELETLRFIHLSFIEYFAANFAVKSIQNGWEMVLDQHSKNNDTRLRELFPFAVFLSNEHERNSRLAEIRDALQDDVLTASCYLECKMYESDQWLAFADHVAALIRSEFETLGSEDGTARLYAFISVLRDAEENGFNPAKSGLSTIDEILTETVKFDAEQSLQAVRLMSRFDAVAGLRLADLCGIDLLDLAPEFVVECCEQPAFIGQSLERAKSSRSDASGWLIAVARAALWVPPARAYFDRLPIEVARQSKRMRTWGKILMCNQSLLVQILSEATDVVNKTYEFPTSKNSLKMKKQMLDIMFHEKMLNYILRTRFFRRFIHSLTNAASFMFAYVIFIVLLSAVVEYLTGFGGGQTYLIAMVILASVILFIAQFSIYPEEGPLKILSIIDLIPIIERIKRIGKLLQLRDQKLIMKNLDKSQKFAEKIDNFKDTIIKGYDISSADIDGFIADRGFAEPVIRDSDRIYNLLITFELVNNINNMESSQYKL